MKDFKKAMMEFMKIRNECSPSWRGFQKDCAAWSDEKKIRLLLRKFGQSKHEKYANCILLRNPGEISIEETVLILKKNICAEKFSIQHKMAVLKSDKKVGRSTLLFLGLSLESVKGSNEKNLASICLNAWFLNNDRRHRKIAKLESEFCLN